ncbi:MAG: hypothetical protein ACK46L_03335 [Synechococcaceae cyanobacterium]
MSARRTVVERQIPAVGLHRVWGAQPLVGGLQLVHGTTTMAISMTRAAMQANEGATNIFHWLPSGDD